MYSLDSNSGVICSEEQSVSDKFQGQIQESQVGLIQQLLTLQKPIFLVQFVHPNQRAKIEEKMLSSDNQIQQRILSYNRKSKSLQQLCKKFIHEFEGKRDVTLIQLDKVTIQLNVERRRIYDIINILESLQIVRKKQKGNYYWRGLKEAINTINLVEIYGNEFRVNKKKKEKSLQYLSEGFLRLLLRSESPITLQHAAKILINPGSDNIAKTKIRRLYDIVNVFRSIGLVRKIHGQTKKPVFEWLGEEGLKDLIIKKHCENNNKEMNSPRSGFQSIKLFDKEENSSFLNHAVPPFLRLEKQNNSFHQNQNTITEFCSLKQITKKNQMNEQTPKNIFRPHILKKSQSAFSFFKEKQVQRSVDLFKEQ